VPRRNPRPAPTEPDPSQATRTILPLALTVAAIGLGLLTVRLPFTAGRPFWDLFAPAGALVCGAVGSVQAFRRRRRAEGAARVGLLLLGLLGALIAVAAGLMLLLIYSLCGAFWTRTSC
jgi:hypothetical protein